MAASRLSTRVAPRILIRAGLLLVAVGAFLLVLTLDRTMHTLAFSGAILVAGIGLGLIASQVTNVNQASAGPLKTSEVGLQGTGQNLGTALGVAIIGSLVLSMLTTTFDHRIDSTAGLPARVRTEVAVKSDEGLPFVPAKAAGSLVGSKGVPAPVVHELEAAYVDAQLDALRLAAGGVVAFALLGVVFTRRLPGRPLRDPTAVPVVGHARTV